MALTDNSRMQSDAPCPRWLAGLSDVALRRLAMGGCAVFWVALAIIFFS